MEMRILLFILVLAAPAVAGEPVPVMVGGNGDLDACMSLGALTSDTHVRSGPGESFSIVGSLKKGHLVWLCDGEKNWAGIVYASKSGEPCDVHDSINPARPYAGKCDAGWIDGSFITVVAG